MRGALQSPARLLPVAFLLAIAAVTVLLLLPACRSQSGTADLVTALFTATSAICVTGLTVVEPGYWSDLGQAVIIGAVKLGGYGIMTAATLLALLVARHLGLRARLLATSEGRSLDLSNIRGVLLRVAVIQLGFELLVAVPLALRWWLAYDRPLRTAVGEAVFHGISAFNNAGFSLFPDSLAGYRGDPWIVLPVTVGVVAGSLGFPVLIELLREFGSPRRWTLHARLTVGGSGLLLLVGFLALLGFEWNNPGTFGPLGIPEKLLDAFFHSAMARSGGLTTIDLKNLTAESVITASLLMFIGGGSASTAGGIKVTTFLLLVYASWSEIRGEPEVTAGRRRISGTTQRQALTVGLLGVALIAIGTLVVEALSSEFRLEHILFDVVSAFGTVGWSSGVTAQASAPAQLVLAALMFIGRVGPAVVAAALALNTRHRLFRYPEERPIVG